MSSNASAQVSRRLLPQLLLLAHHHVARRRLVHHEARDALAPGRRIGDREQHRAARHAGRRDELLGAVDHVAVALLHRPRLQVRRIGSRLRLGQRERPHRRAGRQRPQPAVLLRVGAVLVEDDAGGRVVHAHHGGDRAVAGGDLLQQQRVGHRIDLRAVPLRRRGGAEDAEFAQFADDLRLDGAGLLARRGTRRQAFGGEPARHVDDEGVGADRGVIGHGWPPCGGHDRLPACQMSMW